MVAHPRVADARAYRWSAPSGPAGAQLLWCFSLDAGATWAATLATVTLDEANQTLWGPWQAIPAALRRTTRAVGTGRRRPTQVRILEVALDIRGVDQTSAARLLPSEITPAEIADPVETELRSFSPADVAAIADTGTPAGRRRRSAASRLPVRRPSSPTPRRTR
jgi:hypothetical protein